MPETPSWAARLPEIENHLLALPFVIVPDLENLLQVSARRAQQILMPCRDVRGYCDPRAVIERLRSLVSKSDPSQEIARRRKLADTLKPKEKPLFVAAPIKVMEQRFEVPGVAVEAGEIRVSFENPTQALERLLGLAIAIRNQPEEFEYLATGGKER